ncbi:hypothetical protein JXD38_11495 [candidate division WOR-3 bacterium]|nr:hypothetical protein [candidate division WOR-3 bacterium]
MRCVARVALLAAVLLVAGCNLVRDPRVSVAEIVRITAPDTVHAGTKFDVTATAVLGYIGCAVLDHCDVTRTSSSLELRAWTRDTNKGGAYPQVTISTDLAFSAGPAKPGEFRVIAHQPDGSITEKTTTVLP